MWFGYTLSDMHVEPWTSEEHAIKFDSGRRAGLSSGLRATDFNSMSCLAAAPGRVSALSLVSIALTAPCTKRFKVAGKCSR